MLNQLNKPFFLQDLPCWSFLTFAANPRVAHMFWVHKTHFQDLTPKIFESNKWNQRKTHES